jgi:MFS family permease
MSPTESGLALLPMIAGIFSASIPSGQLMSRTGRYKQYPIISAIMVAVAMLLFSTISITTPYWQLAIYMFLMGAGLGLSMQIVVTAAQNSVPRQHMGTATSTMTFFRSMGGAIGTAVFGAVLTSRLKTHLADTIPHASQAMVDQLAKAANSVQALHSLPAPQPLGWALQSLVQAMDDVFLVAIPFLILALGLALITPEQRLASRDDVKPAPEQQEEADAAAAASMH